MKKFETTRAYVDVVEEIARVFKKSRLSSLPFLPSIHTEAEDIRYFREVVFQNNEICVAQDADSKRIFGFIAFTKEWVNHLYILPEAQGHGLGSQLLSRAMLNTDALQLWTFQKNSRAIDFYLKHGFKIVALTDGSKNEEREPDVLLSWFR